MEIRVIKHEAVAHCGSYEVRADGKPLRFFYWDDLPSRRLRADIMTGQDAKRAAVTLARAERDRSIRSRSGPSSPPVP